MPTYVYRRADGTTFEIEQRITEPALTTDPETGQTVERVISGAGLVFKGSGFYLTDYARKSEAKSDKPAESTSDAPAKSDAAPADKPAVKPDATSATAPAAPAASSTSTSTD